MLNRKELKEEAKIFIEKSYWKNVLVALLLLFALNGEIFWTGGSTSSVPLRSNDHDYEEEQEYVSNFVDQLIIGDYGLSYDVAKTGNYDELGEFLYEGFITFAIIIIFVVVIILLIVFLITAIFQAFILNPLEMGCRAYFVNALMGNSDLKVLSSGYETNYMKNVKILFLRSLYVFLWSLLFIIPGIIKSYEYMMVPYIIKEHPDMDVKEVFALSRDMMTGNKLFAWVLRLSFLGWEILSLCTFCILGVLYLNPYKYLTEANLYLKLKNSMEKTEVINDFSAEMIVY